MQQLTYPGVYVVETESPVRTIMGVATSRTAFVGFAPRGPIEEPTIVNNFGEYQRIFGGLALDSAMGHAVYQFFQNGGSEAAIVRRGDDGKTGAAAAEATLFAFPVEARSPGTWGNQLQIAMEPSGPPHDQPQGQPRFSLHVQEIASGGNPAKAPTVLREEVFANLSGEPTDPRFAPAVLHDESNLVDVPTWNTAKKFAVPKPANPPAVPTYKRLSKGKDVDITVSLIGLPGGAASPTGVYALDKLDIFNLLCLPRGNAEVALASKDWDDAATYCGKRRAILLIDAPWNDKKTAKDGLLGTPKPAFTLTRDAAAYFPRIKAPDPLRDNREAEFPPCGAVAGIIASTDASRGIWKAPAGQDARLRGASGIATTLTDMEQGELNQLGLNCFRTFPATGTVLWGARTTVGRDQLADQWKYLPVRRTALYIEESLYRGTQWVVFEPNDEPLWSQIRLNVGTFMHGLFRQGAFQGASPNEAYFVKCDAEVNPQEDIDRGIVNILVGFAPLKPAEFVVIKISQYTHQENT